MEEWIKIIRQKWTVGIFAGMLLFQLFFFVYSAQQDQKEEAEYGPEWAAEEQEEQAEYAAGFQERIEEILRQSDAMNGISIFSRPDSFSNRNLEKTGKDFAPMLSVQPVLFDYAFLTRFFSDPVVNAAAAFCCVLAAAALADERKRGLRSMIFASANGRGRLAAEKMCALFLWTAVLTVLFYGGTLAVSAVFYQGDLFGCLNAPIQSLPLFADLPWRVGIGGFLAAYFCFRWLALSGIAMAAWAVWSCLDNPLLSAGTIGVLGIAEYLLYRLIGRAHPWNFLHYCNPWYLMGGTGFFSEYRNLNLFSHAVNKNTVITAVWLLELLVSAGAALAAGAFQYPCASVSARRRFFARLSAKRLRGAYWGVVEKLPLSGMEYYKILVSQKGIVVILLVLAAFFAQADFTDVQRSGSQALYYDFLERHEGPPDESSAQEIAALEEELALVDEEYEEAGRLYEQELISADEWMNVSMRYDSYAKERQFLTVIREQTAYLEELREETGIRGWYINQYSYRHLLNEESPLRNVLLILGIVLLGSGIFANEKKQGMLSLIRCCGDGRAVIYRKKLRAAFSMSFLMFLAASALETATTAYVYGLSGLAAPAQSFSKLSFLPGGCSMGVFLALLFLVRGVMVFTVTAAACMFSARTSQKAAIGLALVLCIPALLSLIGFDFFRYLSIIEVLSAAPFLLRIRNAPLMAGISLIFLAAGIWCVQSSKNKWCFTGQKAKKGRTI